MFKNRPTSSNVSAAAKAKYEAARAEMPTTFWFEEPTNEAATPTHEFKVTMPPAPVPLTEREINQTESLLGQLKG